MKLEIKNINKIYKNNHALNDFSLSIENGILGLLGPNGAGKSSLMKIIATISQPSSGMVLLNKNNILKDPNYMRKQLGYLAQDFGVYPNLNAIEFLKYVAALKGIGGDNVDRRIDMLIEGLNLSAAAKKPIGTYSGGMRQRIGIAQALLNEPSIIIFDEPTVGLDPEERIRFRDLISNLSQDAIVILSSHIVSDVDSVADHIVIMKAGRLLSQGTQMELISAIKNNVFEIILSKEKAGRFKQDEIVVSTLRKGQAYKVRFVSQNHYVGAIQVQANLEDAYLYNTKMAG